MLHQYTYKLRTRQTFEEFCRDFQEEAGETLFAICKPEPAKGNEFTILIPEENQKRLRDVLNYGKCHVVMLMNRKIVPLD